MLKVLTALASLVVLTALACTRVCTLIGAEPGVALYLGDVLTDRPATVRVCVDARCVTRQAKTGRWEVIFVPDATLTGPEEVNVHVTVARAGGVTQVNESATVQANRHKPNGPGCEPVVFVASVEVTDDGLQQVPQA